MQKENNLSGVDTTFKDKDGKAIRVHDYVKDGEGNRYFINSHFQAVPYECEAPAVKLDLLMESTELTVLSTEDVLNMKPQEEGRRRGGRHKKEAVKAASKSPDEAAASKEAKAEEQDLHPVTEQMILSVIPDDALAAELRRRGYTLCAYRPALIEL